MTAISHVEVNLLKYSTTVPLAYERAGRPRVIPLRQELVFHLEEMALRDTFPGAENRPQRGQSPQWAVVAADTTKK